MAVLRRFQPGTSDANGDITFTFPATAVNSSWTGTISIPSAPISAQFMATIETNDHLSWQNTSPGGPLTVNGSEQLVVTGTGMAPNTQYTAVMLGSIDAAGMQSSPLPVVTSVLVAGIPGEEAVGVVQDNDVLIANRSVTVLPIGNPALATVVAGSDYQTVEVIVGGGQGVPIAVVIQDQTQGYASAPQTIQSTAAWDHYFIPISVKVGDVLSVFVESLDGSSTGVDLSIVGRGTFAQPSPLRPDGRLYPMGSLNTEFTSSSPSGSQTIDPPSPEVSILVMAAYCSIDSSAPATGIVQAIVAGNVGSDCELARVWISPTGLFSVKRDAPPQGLLMDPGTSVFLEVIGDGTATPLAALSYDFVL